MAFLNTGDLSIFSKTGKVGLNGNWGVPMSVPLGHLREDVSSEVLSKADAQDLKAKGRNSFKLFEHEGMRCG